MTKAVTTIGQPLPRLEDERLLTGRGRYTDDVRVAGQAWCVFVRSPHAHAAIRQIRTAGVEGKVIAVLTAADYAADGLGPIEHVPNPLDALDVRKKAFARTIEAPHWPLAGERVRHVGEPVAAVIADSLNAARDAAERIEVEYEPLPAEERVCLEASFGDAEATRSAIARAAVVVRRTFHHQRIANAQMEPRSALGEHDPHTGRYKLTTGSQGVVRLRQVLAASLRVPPDGVRVVTPDVGGGFGPRSFVYPEQVVVAWAAKRLGRPVKWTSERSESFVSDFQGRDNRIEAALALDAEGRILAYEARVRGDIGAHTVSFVPLSNFRNILTTVYHVPAVHLRVEGRLSHTVPTSPFRGAGRPEAHHALERLLDMAARRLGLDAADIRRRNAVTRAQLPYRTPMGLEFDSGDFPGYLERAVALADYAGFAERKAQAKERGRLRGIGIANYVESPVGAPKERVELRAGAGGIEMVAGTQSTGQGHETAFAQVLAERLGVPIECIRLRTGDTDFVREGGGTHSDRSMRLAGTLIVKSAAKLIEEGRRAAAERLEAQVSDVEFAEGIYRIAGTDRSIGLLELAKTMPLAAADEFVGRIPAYPAGCAVCEVEVDPETGRVQIMRYSTVDDVGQPINPRIVDGQTHGGIAQGTGQALMEGVVFDAAGQLLTGSFMDYALARASDLPWFDCALAEDPTLGNPLRVKGGGEGGIVPATAAVINAICNALDVEDVPMPATACSLWKVIHDAA